MANCIAQLGFKFDPLVVAKSDAEYASTDGGAELLKAIDRQLGVSAAVAHCLRDGRQPGKVLAAAPAMTLWGQLQLVVSASMAAATSSWQGVPARSTAVGCCAWTSPTRTRAPS
jgi:hypothetical protein